MAVTDLNYPSGLIASPYKELPRSELSVQRGSMPGVPLKPTDVDILQPGLGVIPGSAKYEYISLGLVKSKRYPDADTYSGKAFEGIVQFHSPRLPFIDDVITWVAEKVIETTVRVKGGKMLDLNIWMSESSWKGISSYLWTLRWNFYIPGASLGVASASASAIILAIVALLALIALIFLVREVKEIVWGPTDGTPPGVIPSLTSLLLIGGGLALAGIVLLKPKVKKRKKK